MRKILLAICIWLVPATAPAGAWLRDKGTGFFSTSAYLIDPNSGGNHYAGIYMEYGVAARLTLGLDLGRGVSGNGKTIGFLKLPIGSLMGPHHIVLDLGFGEIAGNPTFRPGLSYGRGFSGRLGDGWVSLETAIELNLRDKTSDYKADLTIGLNRDDRHKLMLQFQSGKAVGDPPFLRMVPSVTRSIGKDWLLELGVTQEVIGGNASGLKISLWRYF
ncbi:hypothetical protein TG4357_02918 [Thalassovita gelatinovora]|uniref:Uncharacterized protein n=1 Tax=Thalassovita gelatinovora TaxID=53501 RepID=A0A0P1G3C2_THAGE|nr:hypothetical protein [Thalassovita gelatinovora]QIZ81916.1 hypothetical protein HFZ77_16225 [Thalassovita gelatinovora]CUH67283.1 hypothetical protein TG4357_02918 [Thalassovita gelatinovora]SEP77044.1 hypothetical protein SAMN04488043_101342 [Thalassovita gelatinovora]